MAKTSLVLKEQDSTAISLVNDEMMAMLMEDSGKGVSSSAEDNIVPIIYLLQANSPATKKSNPAYIEGAVAGDIWKRNSIHQPLVKGDEGMYFQPCYFSKVWIEWRPNRGGLAGVHQDRPVDAKEVEVMQEGRPRRKWMRDNGNEVVETRQHIGFAGSEPYVISLSSTGHTVSRAFMQMMGQQYYPGASKAAPSWSKIYKVTTVERNKDGNSWYVYKFEDIGEEGWVDIEKYKRGKALFESFSKGEKVAHVEEDLGVDNSEETPF